MTIIKKSGILGINARNLLYLRPHNKEKSIEIADDKIKTKNFLSARGIPVPKLYEMIKNSKELDNIKFRKFSSGFVIKPNKGRKGLGIIPIEKRVDSLFLARSGKTYSVKQIKSHIEQILYGVFSLENVSRDTAFFEQLITSEPKIAEFSDEGLPDIRIIVHNLIPVMAMLRLPTKESQGKGNLHLGAIGAGIDIAKGEVTHAVVNGNKVYNIPEKGNIRGLKIPYWDDILHIAIKAQIATNLGYLAADLAIDKNAGPMLLEINARAGISIQLANMQPLRKRLEKTEDLTVKTSEKGIRIAKDLFGYTIEKNIKTLSGKKIIGLYEDVDVIVNKNRFSTKAFVNTAKKQSLISLDFAYRIGLIKSKKYDLNSENLVKAKLNINGKKLITFLKLEKIKKKYQIVLGQKDINENFYLDPSISKLENKPTKADSSNIFVRKFAPEEVDQKLCSYDHQIFFLKNFRPLNLNDEREKLLKNINYHPRLIYPRFDEELLDIKKDLKKTYCNDSALGQLFQAKINHLVDLIDLIKARGSNEFQALSNKVFGEPNLEQLLAFKKANFIKITKSVKIDSHQLKKIFEDVLEQYNINNWRIILSKNILSKCVINKDQRIYIKNNARFSKERIKHLIIHELETHLLTSHNGAKQKYGLFQRGFANFIQTQEGLAIYNIYDQNNQYLNPNIYFTGLAIYHSLDKDMMTVFEMLRSLGVGINNAINILFRIKRGLTDVVKPGCLTKDFNYLSGFLQVKDFVENGGNLQDLYYGKYNLQDLDLIKSVIEPADIVLPKWLI